jgi:hypothetical protein
MWAAERPQIDADGFYGYGDAGPYTAASIQTPDGTGGYWEIFYRDEFARSGEIYGSVPDGAGGVAYGGGAGGWTGDGSKANSAATPGNSIAGAYTWINGGRRRIAAVIGFSTVTGAGTDRAFNLAIGAGATNRIISRVTMTSAGVQTWVLQKVVGGVTTTIVTAGAPPLAAATVDESTWSIELNPDNTVTAKIGAATLTGTLSGAETTAVINGTTQFYFFTGGAAANTGGTIYIARAYAERFTAAAPTLTVYNGARSGVTAEYQLDRIAGLYPSSATIDVLFVCHGHNYYTPTHYTPAEFHAALDEFINAYRAAHPESGVVICSQNPQYPPSPTAFIAANRARNSSLRQYAERRGYAYLPIGEFYAGQADGGRSWVDPTDGAHPLTAAQVADPANGSYHAAVLLKDYLDGASLRP